MTSPGVKSVAVNPGQVFTLVTNPDVGSLKSHVRAGVAVYDVPDTTIVLTSMKLTGSFTQTTCDAVHVSVKGVAVRRSVIAFAGF
jgi:carbon monoxide dehydrogenase subunit G